MSASFASSSWADQLGSALSASPTLRSEAADWVFGPVLLVVDADAEHDVAAAALRLDLNAGECRGVSTVPVEDAARNPFVVEGTLARWKSVFGGELSLVDGILDSKLRLSGDLPTVTRHRAMFDALVAAGGELETTWPQDEVAEPANA
ncbi:MAG: hypothetical protein KDC46_06335 [Thermoleophilia bacterium]|nr:hypothetical protein [Thermoleophilia bacterium]